MSKAEKFIQDRTRNCSNIEYTHNVYPPSYHPWLTPNQARRAVEVAREETIEKACDAYCKVCGHYPHTVPTHICRQGSEYYKNFKKNYMKGNQYGF